MKTKTIQVTSNGKTGKEWIEYLEKNKYNIGDYAKELLLSDDFKPTKGVTYEIGIIKGDEFSDNERNTANIRKEAKKRGWITPNAEVACLIREKFTNEELEKMGLWAIITMHEPVKDSDGDPYLLHAYRSGGGLWLGAYYDDPDGRWIREYGFAFALSQVSTLELDTQPYLDPLPLDLKSFQTLVIKELLAKIQLTKAKQEFGNDYVFGYDDCLRIILEEINK